MLPLQLSAAALATIHAHATETFPEECCGAMLGTDDDAGLRHVTDVLRIDNVKDDNRTRRYVIPPDALLQAEKTARARRLDVVGIYHSHPNHPSQASEFDREHALPYWSYVIVSCMEGTCVQTQSWRLHDDRSAFAEEPIAVIA